jgi:hypothetical protein
VDAAIEANQERLEARIETVKHKLDDIQESNSDEMYAVTSAIQERMEARIDANQERLED